MLVKGFVLGWSVAWPPGPINAEMVRRSLTRGFFSAYSLSLGACSSDFLWALAVALGAGAVAGIPGVRAGLGVVSTGLLIALAWVYLGGAVKTYRAYRSGSPPAPPKALDSVRGGYALGFLLALTSPWNIAFWLAVIGDGASENGELLPSLVMALAVVGGSAAWGLVLCSGIRLGARFATPQWDVATRAVTGALMLGFAVRAIWRLFSR